MNEIKFIVILTPYSVWVVEMDGEREWILDNVCDGDIDQYVDGCLTEEFGFSPNERDWMEARESQFRYTGKIPQLKN